MGEKSCECGHPLSHHFRGVWCIDCDCNRIALLKKPELPNGYGFTHGGDVVEEVEMPRSKGGEKE